MKSSSIPLLSLLLLVGVSANEAFQTAPLARPTARSFQNSIEIIDSWRGSTAHMFRAKDLDRQVGTTSTPVRNPDKRGIILGLRGGAFIPGQEVITFSQNLAGSVFSTAAIMYGLACGLAPRRTARLFYGYDDEDKSIDVTIGKFLMRMVGSIACGIGLTAAFAIGSELKELGHMPKLPELEHAIGIGAIPRALFLAKALFGGIPSSLRIKKTDAWLALSETAVFIFASFTGRLMPEAIINFEVAFCLLLGPLFFFKPKALFEDEHAPSKHEKLMTRLMASYSIMNAVLLAMLMNPAVNALPSVGLTALVWVASLFHITFVRADVKDCGSSVLVHIAMMASGIAVASGGLRHYLVV